MPGGFGGMMSFEVVGATAADRFERARRVAGGAALPANLGGGESLVTHPASMIFSHQSREQLAAVSAAPGLLRLSVGLEDPERIIDDLASTPSGARG